MSNFEVKVVVAATDRFTQSAEAMGRSSSVLSDKLKKTQASIEALNDTVKTIDRFKQAKKDIVASTTALEKYQQQSQQAAKATQQATVKLDALKVAHDKSSHSSDAMNNKFRESVEKLKELKKASAQAQEQLKNTSKISWNQFTAQRMSKYMKDLGGHKNAIKQISKEYAVYKKTGVNAFDDVSESSKANQGALQQAATKAAQGVEKLKLALVNEKKASGEASKAHQQLTKELKNAEKAHASATKAQQQAE